MYCTQQWINTSFGKWRSKETDLSVSEVPVYIKYGSLILCCQVHWTDPGNSKVCQFDATCGADQHATKKAGSRLFD